MAESVTYVAGGTVQAGGGIYIPRQADQDLLNLCLSGQFAYILTPRQMGKSSLMVRTAETLQQQNIRTVIVDLTKLGTQASADAWYLGVLTIICRQLKLLPQLVTWWRAHEYLGVTQRLTQFFEEVVLSRVSERIVIFIDEIDTTLNLEFADDFFIAIRYFYLARAENKDFERLSFVLIGVATPTDLIRDPQRTPFNIGERVDLSDFTFAEALPLAPGLAAVPESGQQVLKWVLSWTGGHPYLTQRLCSALTQTGKGQPSEQDVSAVVRRIFLGEASRQDTNLQFVRDMLTKRSPDLVAGLTVYREVLGRQRVLDEEQSLIKSHLKLSGVVKQEEAQLQVRNPIYQKVFSPAWAREHLPVNWVKRLRRAAIAAGVIFLASTAPLAVIAEMSRQKAEISRQKAVEAREEALAAQKETELALAEAKRQRQTAEDARQEAEDARQEAEDERIEAEDAKIQAELAQEEEAEQRQKAEAAQLAEVAQRQKAEAARLAEAQQRERAEAAQLAEAQQRQRAEAAQLAEAQQRQRAEAAQKWAEQQREVAQIRERSFQSLVRLDSPKAVEGLILAMYSMIKSQDVPEELSRDTDLLAVVESSLLQTSEAAAEQVSIGAGGVIAISADGQRIVNGSRFGGRINSWSRQGELVDGDFLVLDNSIVGLSLSGSGQVVTAIDQDGIVRRGNLTQNILLQEFAAQLGAGDELIDSRYRDVYEIEGQAGQFISISMESDDFDTFLRLENSAGELVVDNNDSFGTPDSYTLDSYIEIFLPTEDTYRVIATSFETPRETGVYSLQISSPSSTTYSGETSFDITNASFSQDSQVVAAALADGSVATRNLPSEQWTEWIINSPLLRVPTARLDDDDEIIESSEQYADVYNITGEAGQTIEISMTSSDFSPQISVENDVGDNLIGSAFSEDETYIFRITLPESGIYKVIATHAERGVPLGMYSIQINKTVLIEPPLLSTTTATLDSDDEVVDSQRREVYTINGVAGQRLAIQMESDDFDTFLRLEDSDGELVAENDDGFTGNFNSFIDTILPKNSRYRIIATHFGASEASGSYSLRVNQVQRVLPSLIDEPVATLDESDDLIQDFIRRGDIYPFTGEAEQEIVIRMETDNFDGFLSLQDEAGEILTEGFSPLRAILPEEGIYSVVASTSSDQTGSYSLVINPNPVNGVSISPDGRQVVTTTSEGVLQLWDSQGNPIGEPFQGHQGEILSVAFSADGQRIVSGGRDRTTRAWTLSGEPIGEPFRGHDSPVLSVAFSADGQRIVSGAQDGTVRLSNLNGAPLSSPFRGHGNGVVSVMFSPSSDYIASVGLDGTVRLWDAAYSTFFQGHTDNVVYIDFSPDGEIIASASVDRTVRLWDADTGVPIGRPLRGHEDTVISVAFSPDGERIASASYDRTIRLWDSATGQPIGQPLRGHDDIVEFVTFSPDDERIASASWDGTIRLWNAETGVPIGEPLRGHEGPVYGVAFSPDSTRIASSGSDGTIRLWDSATGQPIGQPFQGHEGSVYGVAFHPDGTRIVSSGVDRTIRLWNSATGQPIGQPFQGHEDIVFGIAFSPDGTRITSGSADRTIRLWDSATGQPIGQPFRGHEDGVVGVAFSPDGTRIASGSWDDTVRLWSVSSADRFATACNRLRYHATLLNPDESFDDEFLQIASEVRDACEPFWQGRSSVFSNWTPNTWRNQFSAILDRFRG